MRFVLVQIADVYQLGLALLCSLWEPARPEEFETTVSSSLEAPLILQ
jgi:hypothetical protein